MLSACVPGSGHQNSSLLSVGLLLRLEAVTTFIPKKHARWWSSVAWKQLVSSHRQSPAAVGGINAAKPESPCSRGKAHTKIIPLLPLPPATTAKNSFILVLGPTDQDNTVITTSYHSLKSVLAAPLNGPGTKEWTKSQKRELAASACWRQGQPQRSCAAGNSFPGC